MSSRQRINLGTWTDQVKGLIFGFDQTLLTQYILTHSLNQFPNQYDESSISDLHFLENHEYFDLMPIYFLPDEMDSLIVLITHTFIISLIGKMCTNVVRITRFP